MVLSRTDKNFLNDNAREKMLDDWRNDAAYANVPSFVIGSDGIPYKSTIANGVDDSGSNIGPGAVDPVGDLTGTWEEFATGGATGAFGNKVFFENDQNVTSDYTITSGKNAVSAGPVTIDNGVTVTVPTGSTWTIV